MRNPQFCVSGKRPIGPGNGVLPDSTKLLHVDHSRLLPISDAFFIQRGHRRSLPILRKGRRASDDGHRIKRALYIGIKRLWCWHIIHGVLWHLPVVIPHEVSSCDMTTSWQGQTFHIIDPLCEETIGESVSNRYSPSTQMTARFEWDFSYFQVNFSHWWLRYLMWKCLQMTGTGPYWWLVNIWAIRRQVIICASVDPDVFRHTASPGHNELKLANTGSQHPTQIKVHYIHIPSRLFPLKSLKSNEISCKVTITDFIEIKLYCIECVISKLLKYCATSKFLAFHDSVFLLLIQWFFRLSLPKSYRISWWMD